MRVFVASSYDDLSNYRKAATRSILTSGNITADMLYWPAEEAPPLDVSLRQVRAADVVILIVAHRYGAPPAGHSQSITEMEFDEAVKLRIPVLAFRIDPDHPWPPRWIETDPDIRGRLERFTQKIITKVTTKTFSSPESLEVAIAHALASFKDRQNPAVAPRHAGIQTYRASRAESLYYSPDSVIQIGRAPDGAALMLSVKRSPDLSGSLTGIAAQLGKSLQDPPFTEMLAQLHQEGRAFATSRGSYVANAGGRTVDVFVADRPLIDLTSPSLFQSMLSDPARTSTPDWPSQVDFNRPAVDSPPTIISGVKSRAPSYGVDSLGGMNRFLCVALDLDQKVWSGGWAPVAADSVELTLWRPFIEEGLERLGGVQYAIQSVSYGVPVANLIETEQAAEFHQSWVDLLTTSSPEQLGTMMSGISVPRSSVMRFVLELVQEVAELHQRGQIHGDIKPSNILVSRADKLLIDDVGLNLGDVSPAVTPGWSPVEQLLRQPLTCAADVYTLGQILLRLVDGELLGREASFRLPGGQAATVFDDPEVYLSPDSPTAPAMQRDEWCHLIEKSLKTDAAERWSTAGELVDAMGPLVADGHFPGTTVVRFPWGDQPSLVYRDDDGVGVGWVMRCGGYGLQ
jgi:hypothetical protein